VEIRPTLLRRNSHILRNLFFVGLAISAFTVLLLDIALQREMAGIYASRPFDVIVLIGVISILVAGAIIFYPLLLYHHRQQVYIEDEVERLNALYRVGFQACQERLLKEKVKSDAPWEDHQRIWDEMVSQDIGYSDFVYLHRTYLTLCSMYGGQITQNANDKIQTSIQAEKEILRGLINATAEENLEDTTHSLSSYLMPVSYCMIAVAFGFIVFSIIPLFGTGKVQVGGTSIDLVWASGGFLGAYIYSFFPFFQRLTRGDMPPRAFLHYALRVFLGTIAVAVFGNLFLENKNLIGSELQFATAVVLGSVPFYILNEVRTRILGIGRRDILRIDGITHEYMERLSEEGIEDIENLAFANPDDLSKRTMLNRNMIFDWKDQAILALLTDTVLTENWNKSIDKVADKTGLTNKVADKTGLTNKVADTKEKETLYKDLRNIGICNVTSLVRRLDKDQSKNLLKMMGLDNADEYAILLTSISVQGKELLGVMAENTITSPMGRMG
jgi:hypothetical protein